MEQVELKSCPFCGGEGAAESETCGWRVKCIERGCYTSGPWPDDCTEAEAITAWNTRTTDQAKDEEIAELIEALEVLVGETLVGDLARENEKAVTPRGSYSTWISWSDRWAARDLIAKHKGRSNG